MGGSDPREARGRGWVATLARSPCCGPRGTGPLPTCRQVGEREEPSAVPAQARSAGWRPFRRQIAGYGSQHYPDQMMGLSGSFPGTAGSILSHFSPIKFTLCIMSPRPGSHPQPCCSRTATRAPPQPESQLQMERQTKRWVPVTSRDTSSPCKRKTLFSLLLNTSLSLKLQQAGDRVLPP